MVAPKLLHFRDLPYQIQYTIVQVKNKSLFDIIAGLRSFLPLTLTNRRFIL